jgi:hypothetical protein
MLLHATALAETHHIKPFLYFLLSLRMNVHSVDSLISITFTLSIMGIKHDGLMSSMVKVIKWYHGRRGNGLGWLRVDRRSNGINWTLATYQSVILEVNWQ